MENVQVFRNAELIKDKGETASLPKIRSDFIAKLENALMFLDYKHASMWHSEYKSKVNLRAFDGAWLVDVSLRHEKKEGFSLVPFGSDQVTPDMFPDLNIKIMNLTGELAQLWKYKFLTPKEKRNLARYRYIFSEKRGVLDYGKQKWWTDIQGYGFNKISEQDTTKMILPVPTPLKGGYYIEGSDISQHITEQVKDAESPYMTMLRQFHMSLQLSLTYYYEWSCYIRETPDSLGVRIPIHPSSSKEVFVMRNIPEGASRRKAIVNYVKDHYRTITDYNGEERAVLIKKHFRGELKFNWRGLEVHVTPSAYDLNRIKTKKKFKTF